MEHPAGLLQFRSAARGPVISELFPQVIPGRASGKGCAHLIIDAVFVTALLGLLISCVKTTNEMTQL